MRLIDRISDLPCYGAAALLRFKAEVPTSIHTMSKDELRKLRTELESELEAFRRDPSVGFGKELRGRVESGAAVIVADHVAEFFFEHYDAKEIGFADVPNACPPFPRFWVEFHLPRKFASGNDGLGIDVGMLVESEDLLSMSIAERIARSIEPGVRFKLKVTAAWQTRSADVMVDPPIMLNVAGSGRIIGDAEIHENGTERALSCLERLWVGLLLCAVSFIHCKNVTLADSPRLPSKLAKAREKRGRPPLVKFRVLMIDGMAHTLRTEGRSGEVGIKKALHICRGHFKTYTPARPLFGRVVGTFFVPQHVRGNPENGVVVKDYAVKPPPETTAQPEPRA